MPSTQLIELEEPCYSKLNKHTKFRLYKNQKDIRKQKNLSQEKIAQTSLFEGFNKLTPQQVYLPET